MNKLSLFWQVYTVLVYTCICMQCILCTCMHVYLIVQLINLIISYMYAVWYFKSYSFRLFWTISNTFMFMKTYHIRRVGVIFFMPAWLNSILNIFPIRFIIPSFNLKFSIHPHLKSPCSKCNLFAKGDWWSNFMHSAFFENFMQIWRSFF